MRRSFWDRRFPTFLGLLLLTASTIGLAFVTKSPQLFELKASPLLNFSDRRVSNQTPTSLSISFRTKDAVSAQLRFGQTLEKTSTIFDDRDEIGKGREVYRTHYFTVTNLNAGGQYIFAILLSDKIFDNDGRGFSVKTVRGERTNLTQEESTREPVRGILVTPGGSHAEDALVFIKIDGVAPLSTLVKSQGRFLVPLTNLYTADLTSFYSFKGDETITIEAVGSDGTQAMVKVPFGKHADVGKITLGQNTNILPSPTSPPSSGFDQSFSVSPSVGGSKESTIDTPKDGDFLIDTRPLIRGKANPESSIEITVESDLQSTKLEVDTNGTWSYQPEKPLAPGKHTVSVRFFDRDKVTKVLQNQFEVLASGSQVAESATPSSTATPMPTQPQPTAVSSIPNTGTTLPGIVLLSVSFLLFAIGFVILTRFA